jgi:hypothetical protein
MCLRLMQWILSKRELAHKIQPRSQSENNKHQHSAQREWQTKPSRMCVLSELHGIAHKHRRRSLMCSLA